VPIANVRAILTGVLTSSTSQFVCHTKGIAPGYAGHALRPLDYGRSVVAARMYEAHPRQHHRKPAAHESLYGFWAKSVEGPCPTAGIR
jgi:hypothetical protein